MPRVGDAGARGTGWIASVEKTVLRHRFAFTIGNLRSTTVDQYIGSEFRAAAAIPAFRSQDYFLGFNITRLVEFEMRPRAHCSRSQPNRSGRWKSGGSANVGLHAEYSSGSPRSIR